MGENTSAPLLDGYPDAGGNLVDAAAEYTDGRTELTSANGSAPQPGEHVHVRDAPRRC
ncbi:hypothetical protein [Streptomyces sp. NBC_00986]|uniref:hypothetical protein n=1 Tax=Streptomyces sp. NBC_00986 TaxID=2903702 RepID=UPI0038653F03|nr:hypothetical protein OG504_45405 [Streptomyces sp. NBC_00986]